MIRFLLALLWLSSAMAYADVYRVFGSEQGLLNQTMTAAAEDPDGLLWVGTEDGLYRISDRLIRRIDLQEDQRLLPNPVILALLPLRDHRLLISTAQQLAVYHIAENRMELLAERLPALSDPISTRHFFQDRHGQIWFVSGQGQLFTLDGSLSELTLLNTLPAQMRWKRVWVQDNGTLWLMGQYQLWQLDAQGQVLQRDLWQPERGELYSIAEDLPERALLASTGGLFALDLLGQKVEPEPIWDQLVWDLAINGYGDRWLLSRGQLWFWPAQAAEPERVEQPWQAEFRTELVGKLHLDGRGRLWLLSDYEGVLGYRPAAEFVLDRFGRQRYPAMSNDTVWSIFAEGDELYLGTDGGIQWFDRALGTHRLLTLPGLSETGSVWALLAHGERDLLIGSSDGLYRLDRVDKSVERLDPAGELAMRDRRIWQLVADGASVWLLTDLYAYRWWPGQQRLEPLSLADQLVSGLRNVVRDGDGVLWLGGQDIWGYLDEDDQYHSLLALLPESERSHEISMILPLSSQRIWFGSFGRGIWQYDSRWQDLLPIGSHWGIQCDNPNFAVPWQSKVILGCDTYLYEIDPVLDEVIGLDQYDGLGITDFNEGALFADPHLGLMVGSVRGMTILDPDRMSVVGRGERPIVESLNVHLDDGRTILALRPEAEALTVPADHRLISLQFASNRLLDPTPKPFRYRLIHDGVAGEPVAFSHPGQLMLSPLPYGAYVLELYGAKQGVRYDLPSRVHFTVAAHWWQLRPVHWAGLALIPLALLWLLRALLRRRRVRLQALQQLDQSQRKLKLALSASRADTWEWGASSNQLQLRDRQCLFSADGMRTSLDLDALSIHPDDRLRVRKLWRDHVMGHSDRYEARFRQADHRGRWRWLWATGQAVVRDHSGRALKMTGIYTDITDSRRLEQEHSLYALAFEHAAEGGVILDGGWRVDVCNPAAASMLALPLAALRGSNFSQFWLPEQPMALAQLAQLEQDWQGEITLRGRAGKRFPALLNVSVIQQDGVRRWVLLFSDISSRKQAELALAQLANFDPLTGLANRSHFTQQLQQRLEENRLLGEPVALMFLDLDRFKHINDTYGHPMGDTLLIETANRLREALGESEILGRFGGDEFLILIPHYSQRSALSALAQRLLAAIAEPFELQGQVFYLSTSIGIACAPQDAQRPDGLIKHADLAMYQAKEAGRGQCSFYSHQRDAQATYQLENEHIVRQALHHDRLQMVYQLVYDIEQQQPIGAEALLRCNEPQAQQQMVPEQFIALAEANGFILELDRWALKRACEQFARWGLGRRFTLAVNVSARHFRQADFVEYVAATLRGSGLAPQQLCLEITERVLMRQISLARRQLQALRELGVSVAIDDFGTGYSSLAYLSQFAVDQLKIDRRFIQGLSSTGPEAAIVRTIIDLGRNLQLEVVAEGVESREQLTYLQANGCHLAQGYYFAKPMSAEQCCIRLQAYRDVALPAQSELMLE
ncbi:EAL domain-containing protein [Ferrimonas pelagia]|uniref:EAL domain-containing protein n=1 Tax=Ferrimonas pelagia TaxID=1177826 RepID=A0ABP9FDU9_9GAMM